MGMTGGNVLPRRWVVGAYLAILMFVGGCVASNEFVSAAQLKENQYFTLQDLEGQPVSLRDVLKTHKAVLINFWATWCPPCKEEIPGFIESQKAHGGQGFIILGVDVGESQKKVAAFAKKQGINYPVLLDSDMAVADTFKVVGIPTSLLVLSDGSIVDVYHSYSEKLVLDIEKALM